VERQAETREAAKKDTSRALHGYQDDGGTVVLRGRLAPEVGALAGEVVGAPGGCTLAARYGEEACLYKNKRIYKPPGAKGYGLHKDWIAWPGFPHSFLTVLVPFDRADADNGCTIVFPGYHKKGSLSPEDGHYHELSRELIDESRGVPLELEPGDLAIFGGFTPHCSAPNRSDRWRRQLYLSYNKLSDGGRQRERHYEEFHCWLRVKYAEYGKTNLFFR